MKKPMKRRGTDLVLGHSRAPEHAEAMGDQLKSRKRFQFP
jgi:hypothetical protein